MEQPVMNIFTVLLVLAETIVDFAYDKAWQTDRVRMMAGWFEYFGLFGQCRTLVLERSLREAVSVSSLLFLYSSQ